MGTSNLGTNGNARRAAVRRRARIVLVMLLLAIWLVPVAAEEDYTVGVLRGPTAIAFAPLLSGESSQVAGRDLVPRIFPSPDVLVARIISGDVDAATIPSNLAAQLYNRGVDIEVVCTFIWGVLYVVGPQGSDGLSALSNGEVYAPGRGATPDLVLRYLLDRQGLSDSVTVRYGFSQVEIAQLLIAGQIDYAVLPEPFVTRVLRGADNRVVVADLQRLWLEETGLEIPQTVLVTVGSSGRPAAGAPTVPGDLVSVLTESVYRVNNAPQRALAQVDTLGLGLDEPTAMDALPRLNLRVETARESRPALEAYFAVLEQFNDQAIGGRLPEAAFYGE